MPFSCNCNWCIYGIQVIFQVQINVDHLFLCVQISPLFKKNFALLRKLCDTHHPFEIIPAPYPVIPWVAPRLEHKPIMFKIEDSECVRLVIVWSGWVGCENVVVEVEVV